MKNYIRCVYRECGREEPSKHCQHKLKYYPCDPELNKRWQNWQTFGSARYKNISYRRNTMQRKEEVMHACVITGTVGALVDRGMDLPLVLAFWRSDIMGSLVAEHQKRVILSS